MSTKLLFYLGVATGRSVSLRQAMLDEHFDSYFIECDLKKVSSRTEKAYYFAILLFKWIIFNQTVPNYAIGH